MTPFTEELRYDYPLTRDSIVLDCGGYEGEFAAEINRRYGCWVFVLEPIKQFYDALFERFKNTTNVLCANFGIAAYGGCRRFSIKGSMTGEFADNPEKERVMLFSPEFILRYIKESLGSDEISLIKLNIEGHEFEVLESILDKGLATRFKNIAVQFHWVVPNAKERCDAIIARLKETHEHTWGEDPSFHMNFRLK